MIINTGPPVATARRGAPPRAFFKRSFWKGSVQNNRESLDRSTLIPVMSIKQGKIVIVN